MKSFADKLRELMADRGLSIAELGRRTGIDRGTIHHYLSGDYLPKLDKTEKLAAALGCSVSYLTGLTDEPAPIGVPDLDSFLDKFVRMTQPGSFGPARISAEEARLVVAYRQADPAIRAAVLRILEVSE